MVEAIKRIIKWIIFIVIVILLILFIYHLSEKENNKNLQKDNNNIKVEEKTNKEIEDQHEHHETEMIDDFSQLEEVEAPDTASNSGISVFIGTIVLSSTAYYIYRKSKA